MIYVRTAIAMTALVLTVPVAQARQPSDASGGASLPPGLVQPISTPFSIAMMDDKMGAKPPGGMPMKDDNMGAMAAPGGAAMAGMQARMMSMMSMMSTMPMAGRGASMTLSREHVEGRIAFLQAELAITDAQMTQWHAFANAMRSTSKSLEAAAVPPAAMPGSASERAEREIQLMTVRLEAMRTLHAAGLPLFAVLSDTQKKTADDLLIAL